MPNLPLWCDICLDKLLKMTVKQNINSINTPGSLPNIPIHMMEWHWPVCCVYTQKWNHQSLVSMAFCIVKLAYKHTVPEPGQNEPNASSIGLVLAQFWHIMAYLFMWVHIMKSLIMYMFIAAIMGDWFPCKCCRIEWKYIPWVSTKQILLIQVNIFRMRGGNFIEYQI